MSNITVEPTFNSARAEEGYEILEGKFPHVVPIMQNVQRSQIAAKSANEAHRAEGLRVRDRIEELTRQLALRDRERNGGTKFTKADDAKDEKTRERIAKLKLQAAERAKIKIDQYNIVEPVSKFLGAITFRSQFDIVKPPSYKDTDAAGRDLEKSVESRADLLGIRREQSQRPLPLEAALGKMRADLRKRALAGEPNPRPLLRMFRDIAGREVQGDIRFRERAARGHEEIDPVGLFFWACEDVIATKLEAAIRAEAAQLGEPLPLAERGPLLEELDQKIKNLEYREAAAINFLMERGADVRHRPDSDPLAILQLKRLPDAEPKADAD